MHKYAEEYSKESEHLSLFVDYEENAKKEQIENEMDKKERKTQKAILEIQSKYGKNAALKGMNAEKGGKTKERNKQVGGHKA